MIITDTCVASLRRVSKSYGRRSILHDLTMEFAAGATYVIRGPSGCGKTTVLNLLAGYTDCDAGRVETPTDVGYVLQVETLFSSLSVRDNMRIRLAALGRPADEFEAPIDDALAKLELGALADQPVSHLSGGERQRVQLAGVLVSSPDLVLLDEPTSSLDPVARRDLACAIRDAFSHTTVVAVSHDPELSAHFDDTIDLQLLGGRLTYG